MQSDQGMYGIPKKQNPCRSRIKFFASSPGAGTGSSVYFGSAPIDHLGSAFNYVSNSTLGTKIVINEPGLYCCHLTITDSATGIDISISRNAVSQTDLANNVTTKELGHTTANSSSQYITLTPVQYLEAGDFIMAFYANANTLMNGLFEIQKISL